MNYLCTFQRNPSCYMTAAEMPTEFWFSGDKRVLLGLPIRNISLLMGRLALLRRYTTMGRY